MLGVKIELSREKNWCNFVKLHGHNIAPQTPLRQYATAACQSSNVNVKRAAGMTASPEC